MITEMETVKIIFRAWLALVMVVLGLRALLIGSQSWTRAEMDLDNDNYDFMLIDRNRTPS